MEQSVHIQCAVPRPDFFDHLIHSINFNDITLQVATGLIIASNRNMREGFESASSSLIEVDTYY